MFSPLVAAELRARGHDAVAIKEHDEWQSLSDPEIIALARTEQRAVVAANLRDFRPLHAQLVAPGGDGHAAYGRDGGGQHGRLVEPPRPPPAPMQRYRHQRIGLG